MTTEHSSDCALQLRLDALNFAIKAHGLEEGFNPEKIVEAAKVYEAYLRGDENEMTAGDA